MHRSLIARPGPLVLGLALLLAIGFAIYVAIRKPPFDVTTASIGRGPMSVTIDDEGETRVHDLFVVAAPASGRIERITLEPGDPVERGQIVARMVPAQSALLDPRTSIVTRAQVQALDAAADSASQRAVRSRADRQLAQVELGRIAALAGKGFASKAALDRARSAEEAARAAVAEADAAAVSARFQRDSARAQLATPTASGRASIPIRTPVSGKVMRLDQESETVVAAGSPLIEIGDPATLEIVTDLLSSDAVQVEPGAPVRIERWGGEGVLEGKVREIEPLGFTKFSALGVEEQRVNVVIDLVDPPPRWKRLGHGYRVIVRIETWKAANALQVPISALFRDQGRWAVFVHAGNRARLHYVTIGRMNDEMAEVRSGLKGDEIVVLHPSEKLSDGVRIRPTSSR